MSKIGYLSGACLVVVFLSILLFAQQQENQGEMIDPMTLGPSNAEFYQLYDVFKPKIQKLYTLMHEYQTASPERRDAIVNEYEPLSRETEQDGRKMLDVAIAAFNEAPLQNFDVVNYLLQMAHNEFSIENYENAFKIFNALLIEDKPEQFKQLLPAAAESAFNVMELDKAEQWFKELQDIQELSLELKDKFRSIPQFRKMWEAEQAIRAKETDSNLPRVLLKTNKGDIELVLFEDEAPNTVANFVSLVEKGYYTNVPFHRVLEKFMAQGGDPTGTGSGGPGYAIDCECLEKPGKPKPRNHFRGSISMANAGLNTNGSQFFLTFVPTSFLNGKHTVFGRIDKGIEVLGDLQRIDPEDQSPTVPDRILEAKVLSKRDHEYQPVRNNKR